MTWEKYKGRKYKFNRGDIELLLAYVEAQKNENRTATHRSYLSAPITSSFHRGKYLMARSIEAKIKKMLEV